jgi:hypothetical protein
VRENLTETSEGRCKEKKKRMKKFKGKRRFTQDTTISPLKLKWG